jgi:hypothetical protein
MLGRGLNYTTDDLKLLRQLRAIHGDNWDRIQRDYNKDASCERTIGSLQSRFWAKKRTKKKVNSLAAILLSLLNDNQSSQSNQPATDTTNGSTVEPAQINTNPDTIGRQVGPHDAIASTSLDASGSTAASTI